MQFLFDVGDGREQLRLGKFPIFFIEVLTLVLVQKWKVTGLSGFVQPGQDPSSQVLWRLYRLNGIKDGKGTFNFI